MATPKRIKAEFYRSPNGREPVRDWLLKLNRDDRRIIGKDILKVEFGWPIGMPYCRPLGQGLYEVRCDISDRCIARVVFFIRRGNMILLHGFVKKSRKTPKIDLDLAAKRRKEVRNND